MPKSKILIVDKELTTRQTLSDWLQEEGYDVILANSPEDAFKKKDSQKILVALIGLKIYSTDTKELLEKIKRIDNDMPIVVMSSYDAIDKGVEAIKEGAYDYIIKPFSREKVILLINRIIEHQKLVEENVQLRQEVKQYSLEQVIMGNSPRMKEISELIKSIADSDATVLIQGASGTGKEVVARTIHKLGTRKNKPFIATNCAAIPEELLESELFGYEKGAFTGATIDKKGRFELADGGTLFFDEVGEMSATAQVDLLRVLQEKEFRRVGGAKLIKVDVRIIAASNKNLEHAVRIGKFREDLYYRIAVVTINLPLLRERAEDISLLTEYFLNKYTRKMHKKIKAISEETMDVLMKYSWPGNIRELENAIERAIILTKNEVIKPNDLPKNIQKLKEMPTYISFDKSLEEVEKQHILQVLKETNWNQTKAADILKVGRKTLYNKIKYYKIPEN